MAKETIKPTPAIIAVQTNEPLPGSASVKPTETPLPDQTNMPELPSQTVVPSEIPGSIPTETLRPEGTEPPEGDSSETDWPKESNRPSDIAVPSDTAVPSATPVNTPQEVFWPQGIEKPVTDMAAQVSGDEVYLEQGSQAPGAYAMINDLINANLLNRRGVLKTNLQKNVQSRSKIKVKWIRKAKTHIRLKKGTKMYLKVKGLSKKDKPVWRTKSKKIVSVSKKGRIKAKKKGSTNIIIKVRKKRYVCRVKVK